MDRERLFWLVVLLTQLTQAEATYDVPRALDCRNGPPHTPRRCLIVGHSREDNHRMSIPVGQAKLAQLRHSGSFPHALQ